MERLGVRGVTLNEHEVMIASHLVDPNHLKISWADIAGLDDVIEQIKKTVIYPVLAQQKNIRVSRLVQPPKGIPQAYFNVQSRYLTFLFVQLRNPSLRAPWVWENSNCKSNG